MSLILDALKRSQQEQQESTTVPGLSTQHYPDNVATGNRLIQGLPWLALLLALMAIAWLVSQRPADKAVPAQAATTAGRDSGAPPPVAPQSQARRATPAPEPAPADARSATSPGGRSMPTVAVETEPERAVPAQAEAQDRRAPGATVSTAAPADRGAQGSPPGDTGAPAAPARNTDAPSAQVSALYRQSAQARSAGQAVPPSAGRVQPQQPVPERVPETAPARAASQGALAREEEQSIDIQSMVQRAESELANARLSEHPAPFISSLSQSSKDAIPTILYSRHDYREDAPSSVVLNNKTLRKGGSAASGVRVEEILPDSVVLSHAGTEFRLRALNSWVNL